VGSGPGGRVAAWTPCWAGCTSWSPHLTEKQRRLLAGAAARALGGGARMADFDLSDYLKRSTEASGVPERLSDRDTILDVVRLILARRSVLPTDQRQTSDRQELPTFDRRAS
jgi:hypothetical protein